MTPDVAPKSAIPPYVPYRTFKNFIDSLKVGMPGRIDRSILGSMSGALQSQLTASLRYLGLISDKGLPTESLTKYVTSEGIERQRTLREIVSRGYSFLLANQTMDLTRATTRQIEEEFVRIGAGGQTVRKCIAFFMAICKEAEIPLSPHLKPFQGSSARTVRTRRASPINSANGGGDYETAEVPQPDEGNMSWAQLLLSKFPSFDPSWPDDVKAKWFDAFDKLMKHGQKAQME
jgi:hypothetical protein